jgi:hypothetical protein
MVVLEF